MNNIKSKKMKRKLFILAIFILGLASMVNAQKYSYDLDSSYVASTTDTISYDYDGSYQGSTYYSGIAGFTFTVANYVDTIDYVYLMGSYNDEALVFVDSIKTRTDGNYCLKQAPPIFKKYYLVGKNSTGDTATLKNITFFKDDQFK